MFLYIMYVLTKYPETSVSFGGVHATNKLSDPTRRVILKFCGGIKVGLILVLTFNVMVGSSSWENI